MKQFAGCYLTLCVHAFWLQQSVPGPSESRRSKLSVKAWTCRYVGHVYNDTMCRILDEYTNRVVHRGRTDMIECRDNTVDCMSSIPDHVLDPSYQ